MTRNRMLWVGFWVLALVIGIYGLMQRLTTGHALAAYGTAIPWGLWVALYSFLTSMAAGLYLVTTLPVLFGVRSLRPVVRPGLWAALGALAGGLVSIGLDLGNIFRMWELFFRPNFSSVMAWLGYFYLAFALVTLTQIWLLAQEKEQEARRLAWLGLVVAILMGGGGGALYAMIGSRVYWHSGFMPILFLAGGLLSGAALLTFIAGMEMPRQVETLRTLGRLTLVLLVVELILEWAEFSVGLYGGDLQALESARLVLFGPYAWAFWLLHLALGSVVPLALLALRPQDRGMVSLSGLLVVGTYLTVRLNVVIPGLAVPSLPGLPEAYMEPGLAYAYAPTTMEWLVALFAVSLGVLIFEAGYRGTAALAPGAATAAGKEG